MRLRISFLLAALMLSGRLIAGDVAVPNNINSAYRIQGDRAIAPVQVFDDGVRTYLQLRNSRYPPAVLLEDGRVLSFTPQPPYLVLPGVYDAIVLRYGRRLATIRSRAVLLKTQAGSAGSGQNVWYGIASPERLDGKALDPVPAASLVVAPVAPVASPVVDGFTGKFVVEQVADIAEKKTLFQQVQVQPVTTVIFQDKSVKATVSDIVRLSDFIEQAGRGKGLVIRSGQTSFDMKRRDEVKRQLSRLGVNQRLIRTETAQDLGGKIEVSGDEAERDTRIADASTNQIPKTSIGAPIPQQLLDAANKTEPKQSWKLDTKKTLRDNIDTWAISAGWNKTQWLASNYYQITSASTLEGGFTDVLREIADTTKLNICAYKREKTIKVTDTNIPCKD